MSDLGIICALFRYLLRLSDDADIMLSYNMPRPLRAPSLWLCTYADVDFVIFRIKIKYLCLLLYTGDLSYLDISILTSGTSFYLYLLNYLNRKQ